MAQPPTAVQSTQESLQTLRDLRKLTAFGFVIAALLLLLVALGLVDRRLQRDVTEAEATLGTLQQDLQRAQTPAPAVLARMGTLTTTRALADQVRLAVPTGGLNWPQVIAALDRYDPNRIVLTSLTEVGDQITLTGQAFNEDAVVAYAQAIEESNRFAGVVVQSIRIVPMPTATPRPTEPATPLPPADAQSSGPSLPPLLATATTLAEFVIIVEVE